MYVHRMKCQFAQRPLRQFDLLTPGCGCLPRFARDNAIFVPTIDWSKSVKVFWTELRRRPSGVWYVFVPSTGTDSPEDWPYDYDPRNWPHRSDARAGNMRARQLWVANNKTQIEMELTIRHFYDERLYQLNHPRKSRQESNMATTNITANIAINPAIAGSKDPEMLRRAAESLLARAEVLDSRPSDPFDDGVEGGVIHWTMTFEGGTTEYAYAAIKAGDNLWYTTGPRSPKGYTWEALTDWIFSNGGDDVQIWVATEWTEAE